LLALVSTGCHKEASNAPPVDDGKCTGARCVEQAEAAMYYGDPATAREPLAAVCKMKDGFGCFRLAELHQFGRGGPVDVEQAVQLYTESCTWAYGEGCERRAVLAAEGHGGPELELEFAAKACERDRPLACMRAAEQLKTGRGTEPDVTKAITLFKKACDLAELDGCNAAGDLLSDPEGTPEAKARGYAAYNTSCKRHNAYGCLKVGVAFHDGVGVPASPDAARKHFEKACEYNDEDGCRAAKLLADANGKSVTIELSTKAAELSMDGLEARTLSCRMPQQGLPALEEVMSFFAAHKATLDGCVKEGAAIGVTWEFAGGRVKDVKVVDEIPAKQAKCITAALRKAKPSDSGACKAVLLLGDPDGAAKALAVRSAPKGTHVRVSNKEDE
jgi:TPR repeat protein